MKAKFTRLVLAAFLTVSLAVVATSASRMQGFSRGGGRAGSSSMGRGDRGGFSGQSFGRDRGSSVGRRSSGGIVNGDRGFRGGFGDRDFGRRHRGPDFDVDFFFGSPFFFDGPFGFYPYDYYYYDYGPYPYYYYDGWAAPAPVYLSHDVVAQWIDSHTLRIAWTGSTSAADRIAVTVLDGSREPMILKAKDMKADPYVVRVRIPKQAGFVEVRSFSPGGRELSDLVAPVPAK